MREISIKNIDFRLDNDLIITCHIEDLGYSDEYEIKILSSEVGTYWGRQFALLHIYCLKYGNDNITVYLDDKDKSTCYECKVIEYDKKWDIKLHLKTIR